MNEQTKTKRARRRPGWRAKRRQYVAVAMLTAFAATVIMGLEQYTNDAIGAAADRTYEIPVKRSTIEPEALSVYREVASAVRTVTAYNAGDPNQTDGSPCIGANGDNICSLVAQGKRVCAANFVPFGTILILEGIGPCTVLDRMASRFSDRVDLAMEAHQKKEALAFNKRLTVKVVVPE